MFDKKSDYALNKREKDTIVYISVTGPVLLTRAHFASEEDFRSWKIWSDGDYRNTERLGRDFYDHSIPLDERLDAIGAVASIEDELFRRQEESECAQRYAALLEQIRRCLTSTQYRRLWLYCVEGMTMERIAQSEGVSHQNVSKTIVTAKKKIERFFRKQGAKTPIFL